MLSSGVIVVRDDDDIGLAQAFIIFREPFPGSTCVGGGGEAERDNIVGILLAFADEDGIRAISRLDDFRQSIENTAGILHRVNPGVIAVRASLSEILRLVAHHPEQERGALSA